MTTITQSTLKLIKNLIFTFILTGQIVWGKEIFKMQNPSGVVIVLDLALTGAQQTQGLSGLNSNDFNESRGMLFVYPKLAPRRFWMPNTYFNLDIIFLDPNLKILGIEKNVPAHPGNSEPPIIYKTETYSAQFILEIKASANFGKKLKKNDQLKFIGPTSLSEIAVKTHRMQ